MKKLLSLILLAALLSLSSCASGGASYGTIILNEDGVRVSIVAPAKEAVDIDYEWVMPTEEFMYSENELIVIGTVRSPREVKVEYRYSGADRESDYTLFEFEISRIVYADEAFLSGTSRRFGEGSTILVGVPFNSHNAVKDYPSIADGSEFMMACGTTSKMTLQNETQKLSSIADFWCSGPKYYLFEKCGESYIANEFFKEYVSAEQVTELLDENGVRSAGTAAADAASSIEARRGFSDDGLEMLLDSTVLIECAALENAVANAAASFREGN